MKVWIIASTPFVKDFERIASNWPKDVDYTITPVANFAISPGSIKFFINTYKQINPDVILTDHGYLGFLPLSLLKKGRKPKIIFFLRGNYWLEEKNYLKNIGKFSTFSVTITGPKSANINLYDSHGIRFFYYNLFEKEEKKHVTYLSIYPGLYTVTVDDNKKVVSLSRTETIREKDFQIEITKNISHLSPKYKIIEYIRTSLAMFGWRMTFRATDLIIPVCGALEIEAKKNIKKQTSVCPIPVEPIDFKNIKEIELNHPAAVIIQNHQIKQKSEALIKLKGVINKLKDVTFYISRGLPENRNENYLAVISALEKLPNVQFVDIDGSNKFSYLKSANLYLIPTGLDFTPATVLEAGLAEKPIIASRIGGIPEMISEGVTGWTIENGDENEWVKRISEIISNPDKAQKMGKAARKLVLEKYSLEKVSAKIFELIKD